MLWIFSAGLYVPGSPYFPDVVCHVEPEYADLVNDQNFGF
jgi:hypothetical protein